MKLYKKMWRFEEIEVGGDQRFCPRCGKPFSYCEKTISGDQSPDGPKNLVITYDYCCADCRVRWRHREHKGAGGSPSD
jgi:hypothetical protein